MYKSVFAYIYNISCAIFAMMRVKSGQINRCGRDRSRKIAFAVSHGKDAQEVGALVNSPTRNSLARQTGRSTQTRSARVRQTFRLCPGGEQSTSCSLSEAFFSSRLDERVGRAFMLLSSLVATQAPPPEDPPSIPLSRLRTKNQRAILISLFFFFFFATFAERQNRSSFRTFLFTISLFNNLCI